MAPRPIVFAMANPDPEISYGEAKAAREDVIMATGRSDYPNQVNNVLGFPFIFRGALDVRATQINEEMKLAATRALAALAKEDVPDSVCQAYGVERLSFGPEYLIPKPFDPRVLVWEAAAVARAAMESGVAQKPVDMARYREDLERRLGKAHEVMRTMIHKAQNKPKKIVFAEGENDKILRASHILLDEKIAYPVLLGDPAVIFEKADTLGLRLEGATVIDPAESTQTEPYVEELYKLRQRKGMTEPEARKQMKNSNVYASMMVRLGDADALVSGVAQHYPDTIRPALQIIKVREGVHKVSAMYMIVTRKGDRSVYGPGGATLQHGAAGGDAFILEFRKHRASAVREDETRRGTGAQSGSDFDDRWRDDGRHGYGAGNPERVSVLEIGGRRKCIGVP
jgi:malate dehydrogenase (oxaloacetate-decarboxylating)(NADP+)